MSYAARAALVADPHIVFQDNTQSADLLDEHMTDSNLIALLEWMIDAGFYVLITALRSDHSPDADRLGIPSPYYGTHQYGMAVDCWPNMSPKVTDYMSVTYPSFQRFLARAADFPGLEQIGLAGEADTEANRAAAGPSAFPDDGPDHVHLGVKAA
jgi:hypothetical protein